MLHLVALLLILGVFLKIMHEVIKVVLLNIANASAGSEGCETFKLELRDHVKDLEEFGKESLEF